MRGHVREEAWISSVSAEFLRGQMQGHRRASGICVVGCIFLGAPGKEEGLGSSRGINKGKAGGSLEDHRPGLGSMVLISIRTQPQSSPEWLETRALILNICQQLHTHWELRGNILGRSPLHHACFCLLRALSAEPFTVAWHSANTHFWLFPSAGEMESMDSFMSR